MYLRECVEWERVRGCALPGSGGSWQRIRPSYHGGTADWLSFVPPLLALAQLPHPQHSQSSRTEGVATPDGPPPLRNSRRPMA